MRSFSDAAVLRSWHRKSRARLFSSWQTTVRPLPGRLRRMNRSDPSRRLGTRVLSHPFSQSCSGPVDTVGLKFQAMFVIQAIGMGS
jgi:hypothetical protein